MTRLSYPDQITNRGKADCLSFGPKRPSRSKVALPFFSQSPNSCKGHNT